MAGDTVAGDRNRWRGPPCPWAQLRAAPERRGIGYAGRDKGETHAGAFSRAAIIRAECERAGRTDCADIEIQAFLVLDVLYSITDVPFAGGILRMGARIIEDKRVAQSILAGSPQQITEHIQSYVDAGVTHVIMNIQPPYDPALLKRFASEVMPNVR